MRFGVDAQRLAGQRLGVGRYIEHLVKNWTTMLEAGDRVTLYVREPTDEASLTLSAAFSLRNLRPRLPGQLWQNLLLPPRARELDVLFCPSYSMPLGYRGRCVVAIHSVNEIAADTHPCWYRLRYAALYRQSARRADRVIVPSESTRNDIQAHYGIPAERLAVVPQGSDAAFRPLDDPELMRATRLRWLGADRPYVLWVGKLSQRRNIPTLLEAFAALKRRERLPHALLLFGPNHLELPLDALVNRLGLAGDVVQTDGRVSSHEELVPVYNAADLYVNPSSYEGFSMTLVEAFACGTPVVAVNRAAVGEIANGYALMVDAPSAEQLADAMHRVLTDSALATELRGKSLARAESYRWPMTARLTLDILRSAAENGT